MDSVYSVNNVNKQKKIKLTISYLARLTETNAFEIHVLFAWHFVL